MFGYCNNMSPLDWLFMIGIWVALLGLVIWAVSRLFPGPPSQDARQALDHRLAVGDIDPDTYRHVKQELAGHGGQ